MVEKCLKCGNELPKDAKYCFNCGAKVFKEPHQINEQIHPLFNSLFSKNLIVAALLLGMLFIWIGVIISTYNTDMTGWRAAQTINSLGFFIVGVFLIGGDLYILVFFVKLDTLSG